jgi:hypothetical protein
MHRRVQAPPCTRPKVTLSKDAQAALKLSRQEKSRRFKDALDDAWNELDQATKSIAVSHHKSVRHVQNDLYIGRGLLRSRRSKLNAGRKTKRPRTVGLFASPLTFTNTFRGR